MDPSVFSTAVQTALGSHLPTVLGAIGILVVGYVLALVARAATRKVMSLARINNFLNDAVGKPMDIEGGIALGVFNTLNLEQLSGPFAEMMAQVMTYPPHLPANRGHRACRRRNGGKA